MNETWIKPPTLQEQGHMYSYKAQSSTIHHSQKAKFCTQPPPLTCR